MSLGPGLPSSRRLRTRLRQGSSAVANLPEGRLRPGHAGPHGPTAPQPSAAAVSVSERGGVAAWRSFLCRRLARLARRLSPSR